MKHILHTLFLEDSLNLIPEKYKSNVAFSEEKFFSYANIFELPLYYKLFAFTKKADFSLYDKLQNQKRFAVIEFMIKKVQENKYDATDLLLLYSYICDIVLNHFLDEYISGTTKYRKISSKKMKMNKYSKIVKKIEAQFYKERFYKSIKKHKIDTNKLTIEDNTFETINNLSAKVFYFSYGVDVFKISHKNFIKHQKKKMSCFRSINMWIAKALDGITYCKKYSGASIYYIYTPIRKDFLNKENKMWIKKECYKSFYEIYNEASILASKLITIVSDEIFYKIKKTNEIKHILEKIKE